MALEIPDILWHYCSPETFELILANRTIRLSDVTNCSDKQEIKYARNKYCSLLNKDIKPILLKYPRESRKSSECVSTRKIVRKLSAKHICCVFCLSERDDIEGHWNEHAEQNRGISIGFNVCALVNNNSKINLLFSKILYSSKKIKNVYETKNEVLKQIVSDTFDKYAEIAKNSPGKKELKRKCEILSHECYSKLIDLLLADFASFKKHKFKWEKEWRLILTPTNLRRSLANKGMYLNKSSCFINWWDVSFDFTYAIKAITIGEKSKYTVEDIKKRLKEKCCLTSEEIKRIIIKKL